MFDFEEELKNFEPSLEVSGVEDLIATAQVTDLTDILAELLYGQNESPQVGDQS